MQVSDETVAGLIACMKEPLLNCDRVVLDLRDCRAELAGVKAHRNDCHKALAESARLREALVNVRAESRRGRPDEMTMDCIEVIIDAALRGEVDR